MPFENPIIAGEELIRTGIKSKNFVTGLSGWRIDRNGHAEFEDVDIRGTIQATAARATLADSVNGQVISQNLDGKSTNYSEGATGWYIAPDGTAEFENVAVRGAIGGVVANFNQVFVDGDDQGVINAGAGGNIRENLAWAVGDETWTGAGPHKVAQIQSDLKADHYYMLIMHGFHTGVTVANDTIQAKIRYETGATIPTGTSTVLHGSVVNAVTSPSAVGQRYPVHIVAFILNSNPTDTTFTFGLFLERTAGTGNVFSNSVNGGRMVLIDCGASVPSSGTKFTPAAGSTVTPRRYTKTYNAIGVESYQSNGTISTATGHTDKGYQGDGSAVGNPGGNHGSMWIFDWATISADLAGATLVASYIYVDNIHFYLNSGGKAILGTHVQTSEPATFSGTQDRWELTGIPKGGTKWTGNLGATLGNEFKAGTSKGILLGRGVSGIVDYGYFSMVKVKFTFDK